MVKDDLNKEGYNKEEEYFFKQNQKLIEKKKRDKQNLSQNLETEKRTSAEKMTPPESLHPKK